ncbi:type 1 fimbrial protein, partial [Achromobacter sp. Marseille-Q0513]|uniref:fimbrial protein n=1 Tax=Achromobacter sp. Marseille-Q0513 TaxID=2829161 RepID=UPI001BA331EE|nr:type 1 fimbrial protein [Achromobacter sp. Marseille-Q0513]
MELVKTGFAVGVGSLATGLYGQVYANGSPGQPYFRVFVSSGSIIVPTCKVATASANLSVPLGTVYTSAFTGPGSTSQARNFSIHVDCTSQTGANVYM